MLKRLFEIFPFCAMMLGGEFDSITTLFSGDELLGDVLVKVLLDPIIAGIGGPMYGLSVFVLMTICLFIVEVVWTGSDKRAPEINFSSARLSKLVD
jgi:hypothetical protein